MRFLYLFIGQLLWLLVADPWRDGGWDTRAGSCFRPFARKRMQQAWRNARMQTAYDRLHRAELRGGMGFYEECKRMFGKYGVGYYGRTK